MEQLVQVPQMEHGGFRRHEGALGLSVCRVAGRTFLVRVHDTGWGDTASPGQYINTGQRGRADPGADRG